MERSGANFTHEALRCRVQKSRRQSLCWRWPSCVTEFSEMARIHIVGAGLAGLSAAVELSGSGHELFIYEAAPQAGGRCRSYFDSALGMNIDNGNHLLLSGNASALAYARRIGAEEQLVGPPEAAFDFYDLSSGQSWV